MFFILGTAESTHGNLWRRYIFINWWHWGRFYVVRSKQRTTQWVIKSEHRLTVCIRLSGIWFCIYLFFSSFRGFVMWLIRHISIPISSSGVSTFHLRHESVFIYKILNLTVVGCCWALSNLYIRIQKWFSIFKAIE